MSKETQKKNDEITPKLKLVNRFTSSLQFITYLTTDKKELIFWKEKGVVYED